MDNDFEVIRFAVFALVPSLPRKRLARFHPWETGARRTLLLTSTNP